MDQRYEIRKAKTTFARYLKYQIKGMKRQENKAKTGFSGFTDTYVKLPGGISVNIQNLLVTILLLLTFMLFAGSLSNEMLIGWDDGEYITDPDVTEYGSQGKSDIFSSFHLGMYQPLAVLTFAFNNKLSGDTPSAYILTNLLLHLLNTWLVFRLMKQWFKRFEPAFIVALLFAIHPMHVEGVVWISTRSSLLYSAFFLTGLLQYEKYLNTSKTGHYLLTLLWALLALFSKSMAATFPLILLLIDYFRNRKFTAMAILEKIPFLLFSIIFGIVAIKASASFGHITILEDDYSLLERLTLILYGISFYLVKLILPINLSAIYAFPGTLSGTFPVWVYTPMLALVVMIAILVFARKRRRLYLFGSLFFLLSISMVLPLFWSRIFITADRYTYLPYLGLLIIIADWMTGIWDRRSELQASTLRMLYTSAVLITILLMATTWNRIGVWHDVPTLLGDVIEKQRSDSDMAHGYFYLGNYYDTGGKDEEAVKNYNLAISRNPRYLLAYNNRGILKGKHMDIKGAIADFTQAITLKPDYAEAYYNRGVAYYQQQQPDRACADWNRASQLGFKQANTVISQYCFKQKLPDFDKATSD